MWLIRETQRSGWIKLHHPCPWDDVLAFLVSWEASGSASDLFIARAT